MRLWSPFILWLALGLSVRAWAGVPLALPPGENPRDWADAASLANLSLVSADTGTGVRILAQGTTWVVEARAADGSVQRATVAAPTTAAAREDLVWLAASLLKPVVRPAPAPIVPVVVPKPTPRPAPPAPPVPEPAPEPAPEPVLVPVEPPVVAAPPSPSPAPWSVQVEGGAVGSPAQALTHGFEIGGARTLGSAFDLLVGFGYFAPTALSDGSPGQRRWSLDPRLALRAWEPSHHAWTEAGLRTAYRVFQDEDGRAGGGLVPGLDLRLGAEGPIARRWAVGPTVAFGLDLRRTRIIETGDKKSILPLWTLSGGLRLRLLSKARDPAPRGNSDIDSGHSEPVTASGEL